MDSVSSCVGHDDGWSIASQGHLNKHLNNCGNRMSKIRRQEGAGQGRNQLCKDKGSVVGGVLGRELERKAGDTVLPPTLPKR